MWVECPLCRMQANDLDNDDIMFLRAVKEINDNPDEYDEDGEKMGGEVPASTTMMREVSGLSRYKVRYRMGGRQCRGFEEAGVTVVHEATLEPDSGEWGPKSIELTPKGERMLDEAESGQTVINGVKQDEFDELRERVDGLENASIEGEVDTETVMEELRSIRKRIDEVEDSVSTQREQLASVDARVSGMDESAWGALDEAMVEDMNKLLRRAPAMFYAFNSVLRLDIEEIVSGGTFSEQQMVDARRGVYETLHGAVDGRERKEVQRQANRVVNDQEPPEVDGDEMS